MLDHLVFDVLWTIQIPDFLSGNQIVTWIMDKKSGNWMVITIQLMDYLKSGNWMFPVTGEPITECLLYVHNKRFVELNDEY